MPKITVEGEGEFEVPAGKRLVLALCEEAGIDQPAGSNLSQVNQRKCAPQKRLVWKHAVSVACGSVARSFAIKICPCAPSAALREVDAKTRAAPCHRS
jgi:hypothetical protein